MPYRHPFSGARRLHFSSSPIHDEISFVNFKLS
ncbi:unnamed protein product [Victoria cruziana]